MHEPAIRELDRAARLLLQAIAEQGGELKSYLEAGQLEGLQREVIHLRRSLLGLEMGPLYGEVEPEFVEGLLQSAALPVEDVARRARSHSDRGPQIR